MLEISSTNWLLSAIAAGLLALSFAIVYVASSKKK